MRDDALIRAKLTALRNGEIPPEELYGLIHDFGHAMLLEAEPDVVALLDHSDAQIRCIAVRVLTFHWNISRHWDRLIRLLRDDPDDEVKSFTAAGLGFVFQNARDPIVSQALIDKVRDRREHPLVREAAYSALREVWSPGSVDQDISDIRAEIRRSEEWDEELETAGSREEFQSKLWMWRQEKLLRIEWELVERIERAIQQGSSGSENFSTR
ncbi:MAG: HEAT repeat domain-containing protein [Bacillati bacterium ANGP1]|uniref:HEAT repeat domain-containing protein n=1 Tax=Candidatus Segetimicrobium genomatis TaxID=2569760 RepID=A0A537KY91_9BACT|nr:MAG: HEAT repeat domain-containing protein [Terrabacteria group bacterium ANGP1]